MNEAPEECTGREEQLRECVELMEERAIKREHFAAMHRE